MKILNFKFKFPIKIKNMSVIKYESVMLTSNDFDNNSKIDFSK